MSNSNYTSLEAQASLIGLSTDRLSACSQIGKFYRVPLAGKAPSNQDGFIKWLSNDCCLLGNWVTGEKVVWFEKQQPLNPAEWAERQRIVFEAKQKAEIEQQELWAAAAKKAESIWHNAKPADEEHSYLQHKQLEPIGLRQYRDMLIIPVFNAATGHIQSLQFIGSDGTKRFLTNGKMSNGFYSSRRYQNETTLIISEGWATSESLRQHWDVMGWHLVAFNASNLINIAKTMRAKLPTVQIVIAGDADESGVGQAAANKAALVSNGVVSLPTFTDDERHHFAHLSDWHDRWRINQRGGKLYV